LALNLEVVRLQEKGFTTAFGFFMVVECFFQFEDVRRVHPLGFQSRHAVFIGVDWSTSELLVKIVL
jgi:hypothetical protein